MPSPDVRVTVAEFLSRDLVKVSEWCDLWRMKLNVSKNPQSPALTIGGTVLKESAYTIILGVTFAEQLVNGLSS